MKFFGKNNGFVSFFALNIILLFSLIFMAISFSIFAFQNKSAFRYFCYSDLKESQQALIDGENSLFALNPLAAALRLKLRNLYIQLMLATISKNWPLVASLQQQIDQIKFQQKNLDLKQKEIIFVAESNSRQILLTAYSRWHQESQQHQSSWSKILKTSKIMRLNTYFPKMALDPRPPEENAPEYFLNPHAELIQKIEAQWSLWFFAKKSFQRLLSTEKNWSFKCLSTVLKQDSEIVVKIKADRL